MEIINIWNKPEYWPEVIDFWQSRKALPKTIKAEDRAKELVMMVKDQNKVVGVTTSFRTQIPFLNQNYFFSFRTLIHPDHRIPGLSSKLTVMTRDFLESLYLEKKTDCIGLIVFAENKEILRNRTEAVWRASKLTFIGNTSDGMQMRVYYFKGARI